MESKRFTEEIVKKASVAKTVEELTEIMKAEGITLTEAETAIMMKGMCPTEGELSDDQMNAVAGGSYNVETPDICPFCQVEGAGRIRTEQYDDTLRTHIIVESCKNCEAVLSVTKSFY